MKWRLELKNQLGQHREMDHPASNKALMTTPPMSRQQFEQMAARESCGARAPVREARAEGIS